MRRPPVELRTFRRSDFPALCQIYHEAFEPTSIWKYNFSNVTRQASDKCFKRRLEDWFDEVDGDGKTSEEKMEVIVAVRGEKVLGFSVWEKSPIKSERKEKEPSSQPFPEGSNVERAKVFLGMIKDAAATNENKHWCKFSLLSLRHFSWAILMYRALCRSRTTRDTPGSARRRYRSTSDSMGSRSSEGSKGGCCTRLY